MKTIFTIALVSATALGATVVASAAQPTQADFDACNRAAQAAVSSPSASPQAGRTTGPAVTSPSGTPDSTAGVQPGGGAGGGKTGPMITGSGREPGTTGGVSQGTGAVSQGISTGAASPGASGSRASQLSGMSDRGMSDPAYKTAYQECMKQRGF